MDLFITKELPAFSNVNKTKRVVKVLFPNCVSTTTGDTFKWMPTYEELDKIKKALDEIEKESWNK